MAKKSKAVHQHHNKYASPSSRTGHRELSRQQRRLRERSSMMNGFEEIELVRLGQSYVSVDDIPQIIEQDGSRYELRKTERTLENIYREDVLTGQTVQLPSQRFVGFYQNMGPVRKEVLENEGVPKKRRPLSLSQKARILEKKANQYEPPFDNQ